MSFGVWGIADIFRGNADTSVATVGGTKIDYQTFSRDFANTRRDNVQRAGGELSPTKSAELARKTLQQEIDDTALDNVASRLGLLSTDGQVSTTLRTVPAFRGPLGGFDQQSFANALSRLGYTEAGFVAEIRRDLTREQLVRAGTTGLVLPPGYVHAIFDLINERRAVQYVVLPASAAGPIAPPSDAELEAFVKAHAARFSSPEYRELTYATIAPEDVQNQVQVTEAQLRQAYELRKDTYIIPEKRDIERINFPDEASAKAARAKIDAGAKFEDIAAERHVSPADLALGSLAEADLAGQGPAAFALPVGGITQPVKYTFGWSLLRVTKITPGSTTTFEQARPALQAEYVQRLAVSRVEDIVNAFEDAHNSGDDLVQAAKKAGMRVVHVAAVDAHGLAPDGSKANVPANADFLGQVFKSDVGSEGDPFSLADGHRYALRVDGVVPQKLKPLAAVRAEATAAWLAEQRVAALAKKAQVLAGQAGTAAGLEAIAKQYGASLQSSEALMRDEPTATLNQALLTRIFSAPPGSAVAGPAPAGDSYIVARVIGVAHPPLPLGDPRYQQFVEQLGQQAGSDVVAMMSAAARAQQGVTTNQQQVDRVVGGEGP